MKSQKFFESASRFVYFYFLHFFIIVLAMTSTRDILDENVLDRATSVAQCVDWRRLQRVKVCLKYVLMFIVVLWSVEEVSTFFIYSV